MPDPLCLVWERVAHPTARAVRLRRTNTQLAEREAEKRYSDRLSIFHLFAAGRFISRPQIFRPVGILPAE